MQDYVNYLDALSHLPKHLTLMLWDFGGGAASAAKDASMAQVAATQAATAEQENMFQQTQANLAPWMQAGKGALGQYAGILQVPGFQQVDPTQALRATPGYNWNMSQGVNALDRSAASKGMLLSGPQTQALTKYGQGLADNTYNQYMSNLFGLSGQGQNAAGMVGQFGQNTANQIGQYDLMGGQATAQGIMNAYQGQQQGTQNLLGGLGSLAGIVAAPFTGGLSLLGSAASGLGSLFGSSGGGGADMSSNYMSGYGSNPFWGQG